MLKIKNASDLSALEKFGYRFVRDDQIKMIKDIDNHHVFLQRDLTLIFWDENDVNDLITADMVEKVEEK